MAPLPGPEYNDEALEFAARQVPGCFSVDQVRRSLGQPVGSAANGVEPVEAPLLPGFACEPLHAQCGDTDPQPGLALKSASRRSSSGEASEVGCLFCRAVYG